MFNLTKIVIKANKINKIKYQQQQKKIWINYLMVQLLLAIIYSSIFKKKWIIITIIIKIIQASSIQIYKIILNCTGKKWVRLYFTEKIISK